MPKSTSPFIKTCPLTSKHFGISDDPNMPASNEYHFREERPIKTSPCLSNQLNHGGASRPINLQIIPDPYTEIAVEEQVIPGFSSLQGAEPTVDSILHVPVPSLNHILGVQPVHNKHPSKNLDLEGTRGFPYPTEQRIEGLRLKGV